MAAPPSVETLGTFSVKFARLAEIRSGLSGAAPALSADLRLVATSTADETTITSLTLSTDAGVPTAALATTLDAGIVLSGVSEIQAGTRDVGAAQSLTLTAYDPADGSHNTRMVLSNDGTDAVVEFSSTTAAPSNAPVLRGVTGVQAGLSAGGASRSLALVAYDPLDDTNSTSVTLSHDAGVPLVRFSTAADGPVTLRNVASPQTDSDAANKAYVDALAQGLSAKNAANALVAGNIAPVDVDVQSFTIDATVPLLADAMTFDAGSAVINGNTFTALGIPAAVLPSDTLLPQNRILFIFAGTANTRSGVYYLSAASAPVAPDVVGSATFVRCADMNSADGGPNEIKQGNYVYVSGVGVSAGYVISAIAPVPFVLGTSTITFVQFNAPTVYLGSDRVSIDLNAPAGFTISLSSPGDRGLLMTSTDAASEPVFSSTIGYEAGLIGATEWEKLITVRDPGPHDGTDGNASSGGVVLSGPAAWPNDNVTTGQGLYLGAPTVTGSIRSILKSSGTADTPVLHYQRWDGAAWSDMFTVSPS